MLPISGRYTLLGDMSDMLSSTAVLQLANRILSFFFDVLIHVGKQSSDTNYERSLC